jgi:hypothetical protein
VCADGLVADPDVVGVGRPEDTRLVAVIAAVDGRDLARVGIHGLIPTKDTSMQIQ